ncbi:MAG TPA: hypothetical protein VLA72_13705 [Anaerolineales bacterium]|nr:hypothetical protein [Anaerolineales bacterium]
MTPAKRKTRQDAVEPEEQDSAGKASPRLKRENEESKLSDEPQNIEPKDRQPALTINIQSWTTPIVAVVMLVVGTLAGFYARPSVLGQLPENISGTSPAVAIPTQDRSVEQQQLMASLIPGVRHFIGDSNAPVTIIEFGDFK